MTADTNPVVPVRHGLDHVFHFSCQPGITCWNQCCRQSDITLTPYDVLCLCEFLEIGSQEFLATYTQPFEIIKESIIGIEVRADKVGGACPFLGETECQVYAARPLSCRYYPLGLLSVREAGEETAAASYALVEESYCLGHQAKKKQQISAYRQEQGVEEGDKLTAGWHRLILRARSLGHHAPAPSQRSLQLFYMVCYDHDAFRAFIQSAGFQATFVLPTGLQRQLETDNRALLEFGYRFLDQVLFGLQSIERVKK